VNLLCIKTRVSILSLEQQSILPHSQLILPGFLSICLGDVAGLWAGSMIVFILGPAAYCVWLINSFCICLYSASLHLVSRPALPSQLKPPMGVHLASTLIDESLGMNFQLDLSRYANLSLFFTWFCIPAFSLLHSGVALLEFNLPSLVFYYLPGFHCFFSPIFIWKFFSHVLSRIYSFIYSWI
jgi:hypothetical protein